MLWGSRRHHKADEADEVAVGVRRNRAHSRSTAFEILSECTKCVQLPWS